MGVRDTPRAFVARAAGSHAARDPTEMTLRARLIRPCSSQSPARNASPRAPRTSSRSSLFHTARESDDAPRLLLSCVCGRLRRRRSTAHAMRCRASWFPRRLPRRGRSGHLEGASSLTRTVGKRRGWRESNPRGSLRRFLRPVRMPTSATSRVHKPPRGFEPLRPGSKPGALPLSYGGKGSLTAPAAGDTSRCERPRHTVGGGAVNGLRSVRAVGL